MARRAWTTAACLLLGACGAVEPGSVAPADIPDPTTLARTGRPNDWLICPADACRAETSAPAPAYPVPPEQLLTAWQAVLAEQPRVTMIATDPARRLVMAQDRTRVMRFVDTVFVRVLPAPQGSTFAAYSRSEIGHSDFGTNRRRLEAWVGQLEAKLALGP